jgi:hypothetical protein
MLPRNLLRAVLAAGVYDHNFVRYFGERSEYAGKVSLLVERDNAGGDAVHQIRRLAKSRLLPFQLDDAWREYLPRTGQPRQVNAFCYDTLERH